MKTRIIILSILVFLSSSNLTCAQEWKNLKSYQKETGYETLQEGCWLKKDRKKQNEVWKQANAFNIQFDDGNLKYQTISQIRDFYRWFDSEREEQGHEVHWAAIAAIAASQLSKLEISFIRCFVVRNKEVVKFAHEGSIKVLEFAYPLLKKVYFSPIILKGETAENWDIEYGQNEQCIVLDTLYKKLSKKALHKLNRMVKGKGIYNLAIPKKLKYEGNIENCQERFEYGINKMLQYYLDLHQNNCQ